MIPALRFLLLGFLLLSSVALIGCGAPTVTPPIANLSEAPTTHGSNHVSKHHGSKNDSRAQSQAKPTHYTVRKAVAPPVASAIPRVLLSAGHAKLCLVGVGEAFPTVSLPLLGGQPTELATLRGKQATLVLFWHPDRWMARTALIDMQRDIADKFDAQQVAVVGIAVRQAAGSVQAALNTAKATFPQLIDTEGQAFDAVGTLALPRLYVLDSAGQIVWFDIEYSEGTRRELWQTLQELTKP